MTAPARKRKTLCALAAIAVAFLAAYSAFASDKLVYSNKSYGFQIRQPQGWTRTTRGPFIVQFHEKNFQAFIIVDAVRAEEEIKLDDDFKKFIAEKNEQVRRSNSTFKVLRNSPAKIGNYSGYVTQSVFQSGPVTISMDIYYIPVKNTLFMITTACPAAQAAEWREQFFVSLGSFGELR